eukprot:gb/GEZN01015114.1/.p1 GENE.gb/GEZN01015114.1/~~gb/GEZN01015114.1/.p1  ORF type:complete len:189 (+),score=18.09 gb/GEZN01015114.1/:151-717(+)
MLFRDDPDTEVEEDQDEAEIYSRQKEKGEKEAEANFKEWVFWWTHGIFCGFAVFFLWVGSHRHFYITRVCQSISDWFIVIGCAHLLFVFFSILSYVVGCRELDAKNMPIQQMVYYVVTSLWLVYGIVLIHSQALRTAADAGNCGNQVSLLIFCIISYVIMATCAASLGASNLTETKTDSVTERERERF